MKYSIYTFCATVVCSVSFFAPAWAHKASDAYLSLSPLTANTATNQAADRPGAMRLQLSLAVKDLDAAIDTLDADANRSLTWGEVKAATPDIVAFVNRGVALRCARANIPLDWQFSSLEQRSDGAYVRLSSTLACDARSALAIDYQLFKDVDTTHRLVISGQMDGQPIAAVLAPAGRPQLSLRSHASATAPTAASTDERPLPQTGLATLAHFFPEGVHHIVTGYDHLAFLLTLLLPIILSARSGFITLLRTVTGFTIGHSATLAVASLGWISASPNWVEPAIALTIGVSAVLNLYPVKWVRGDVLALCFGLVHGLGFSGVMLEAGVTGSLLFWGLAGFNLGVEAGQLMMVLLWCAAHWVLVSWVRWSHYNAVVVRGGSYALVVMAVYWMVERLT